MTGVLSHYQAGSGAVLIETREESRLLHELLREFPEGTPICSVAAPSGPLREARTGRTEQGQGLQAGYNWACDEPGRVLVVYDWHMLVNTAGHWRALAEALPRLRSPKGSRPGDPASLVVFVGPTWDLQPANPLKGSLPILPYDLPDRDALRRTAAALSPLPEGSEGEAIVDALCGLSADAAEQSCAEVLARCGGRWDGGALRDARRQVLRDGGLEIWPAVGELGGLAGLQGFAESEILPWIRDSQLSVRRVLCAGVPGVGKSYCARWLAHRLGCECARLSIPALKAGIVGASEANLRRALKTLDALGRYSPLVCVLDEIDTIAREGLDGGTSSGMFAELLTWLQESSSQTVVIATLNRLDKLDAALESRFQARFFFDLPCARERQAVAAIHYRRLACADPDHAAESTAQMTEGFSSRELAEHVCPSVCRLSRRNPDTDVIRRVVQEITPASRTQAEQLSQMRRAASSLRRANDPEVPETCGGRRVRPESN